MPAPMYVSIKTLLSSSKYRGSYNSNDQGEDAIMASRWKVFTFFHSILEEKQKGDGNLLKMYCRTCPHG